MLQIDFLANHTTLIPVCAKWNVDTWGNITGKSYEDYLKTYESNINTETLPITLVAFKEETPIGMATLATKDGCYTYTPYPYLSPWLVSLFVAPEFRCQGVAESIINAIKTTAKTIGFSHMYLLAYDANLPKWYQKLGWENIGSDIYKNDPITIMETTL